VAEFSIFTGVDGPNTDGGDPAAPIILGHIVRVTAQCWLTAIRYWRGATTINGAQKGRLFTVATQTVVPGTAVDFPAPSGTGWQVATLATPVELTPGTDYKVCVHYTDNYSATGAYWSTGAGVGGRVNGPITAPDAGGTPLGIGPIKQGSFAYTASPDTYPDTYFNGGNYWLDLIVSDTPPDRRSGSGTASLTLGATGIGAKNTSGTGTAPLTLAAAGAGAKSAAAAAAAPLTLGATGDGVHRGSAAGAAHLTLGASGTGAHHGTGAGTAGLTLGAFGTAGTDTPNPDDQIDPKQSLKFGGDRTALGGPGGTPPPTMWPKELHMLMYPAGTFFRARTKLVNVSAGFVDSALLRRNERILLFLEEATAVCKRSYESLYITVPICPSGQAGAGSVGQPACETLPPPSPGP
jgi:hypothetical protein